jgi:hypothetical protein
LEPHDLAAVKLLVGRPKDISLLAYLHAADLIDAKVVRTRLDLLDIPIELVPGIKRTSGMFLVRESTHGYCLKC